MPDDLPATILYPAAFRKSLPADFDGAFHWEYINDVLRPIRKIRCSDIDAMPEINGMFFSFETKNLGVEISDATERRTKALLRTGLVTHVDIWGKKYPTQWRFRYANGFRKNWRSTRWAQPDC